MNGTIIDKVRVNKTEHPFLINTNFITKNRDNYDIKSLVYTFLFFMDY
jgi:hypothetical protein